MSLKDFLPVRVLRYTSKKAEQLAREFGAYKLNGPKKLLKRDNEKHKNKHWRSLI